MQCTENQVSSQRSLDSDLGRFLVADFTDEDDIRCLSQHGPDNPGEVEPDVMPDLNLIDARQVIFDRVLGRDDFPVWSV